MDIRTRGQRPAIPKNIKKEMDKMYKTVVIPYSPQSNEMASKIEETANQMEQEGFELVSCSIMPSAKGILIFKKAGESDATPSPATSF